MYYNEIAIFILAYTKGNIYNSVIMERKRRKVHIVNTPRTYFCDLCISVIVFQKFLKQILLIIGQCTINRHRDFSFFLDSGAAFIVTPLL